MAGPIATALPGGQHDWHRRAGRSRETVLHLPLGRADGQDGTAVLTWLLLGRTASALLPMRIGSLHRGVAVLALAYAASGAVAISYGWSVEPAMLVLLGLAMGVTNLIGWAILPLLAAGPRGYGVYAMASKVALGLAGLALGEPGAYADLHGAGIFRLHTGRRHCVRLRCRPADTALDRNAATQSFPAMTVITAGTFPPQFLRDDGRRTATANERLVMNLLSRQGSASRADLARLTGLAPHSITRLVEPLIARGLLYEAIPIAAGVGKPATKLALNGASAFAIGLSVMTDAVSLVLLDLAGNVQATRCEKLADIEISGACRQIRTMIDGVVVAAKRDRSTLVGIGIGVTGYFIGDGARLNPPRLLDPWALVPLDTILADALGEKVWIDNDGNVAAIGEAMLGHGRTMRDFAYLYFSAGFGAASSLRGCRSAGGTATPASLPRSCRSIGRSQTSKRSG